MVRSESRWPQIGILLLVYELFASIGLGVIPPVTLAAIGLQIGLFLKVLSPYLGAWTLWPTSSICMNSNVIMKQRELYRVFTATIFHGSDLHLYYNMVSFAWKGIQLEKRFGHIGFLLLLVVLTCLTGCFYVILCIIGSHYLENSNLMNNCAMGFSGVIFALKMLAGDSDGDFGLFSVPQSMSIWTELLIIQILVPNSSFVGHLAGILAGLTVTNIIPLFYCLTVSTPLKILKMSPLTFLSGIGLIAFHMEWMKRPWQTKVFWSSGTPLVCLSSSPVFAKGEYFRLLSGPLEHAGNAHFTMCLVSILIKIFQLEKKHSFLKILGMIVTSVFISSFVFILAQTFSGIHECVQGLSGPSFSLKVLVLFSGTSSVPLLLFELIELLMLFESRTLLYHMSGLVTGIFIWFLIGKPDPFPGQGIILGGSPPSTRSWGYAHYTDSQFRRIVEEQRINESSRSSIASSLATPTLSQSRERSQRSATPSPSVGPARPRCPPPSDGTLPPPPGGLIMFRESQTPLSDEDEADYTNEFNESLEEGSPINNDFDEEDCPNGLLDHEL